MSTPARICIRVRVSLKLRSTLHILAMLRQIISDPEALRPFASVTVFTFSGI